MFKHIMVVCTLVTCSNVIASANEYTVKKYSVYDGDTISYSIELLPNLNFDGKLRFRGIDTPEIRTRNLCEKAMGYTAKKLLVNYMKGKSITIKNLENGKYAGRLLGDIFADGKNVSTYMLSTGYAKSYSGGKRDRSWCK